MEARPIGEHLQTLAKNKVGNQEMGRRGIGGTPKRKETSDEFYSPAKRRKLNFEKLHTFWNGKVKTSDKTLGKRSDQLITKLCHTQGKSTEIGESESQD